MQDQVSTAPVVCSPDGRPYVPESRPLKMRGLALAALSVPGTVWLANHPLAGLWLDAGRFDWALAAGVVFLTTNLALAAALVLAAGFGLGRSWDDPRGRRGIALTVASVNAAIPVVGFSLLQDDPLIDALGEMWGAVLVTLMLVLLVLASRLFRRSQRYEAATADDALRIDPRPPVIYLRSFRDDGERLVRGYSTPSRFLNAVSSALVIVSPEQELALNLRRVGPVIAIGKPGEALPELGAARLYAPQDRWQEIAFGLLDRAAMVVVRVGTSAGVLWEVDQVLARVPRSRTLFLILGVGESIVAGVREIERRLGMGLPVPDLGEPESRAGRWLRYVYTNPRGPIGAIVGFDSNGHPTVEPIRRIVFKPGDLAHSLRMSPFAGPFRSACRRLFARLGVPWHEVPRRWVAVALAVTVGWSGAHWWYVGQRRRAVRRLLCLPLAAGTMLLGWFEAGRWMLGDRRSFDEGVRLAVESGDRRRSG